VEDLEAGELSFLWFEWCVTFQHMSNDIKWWYFLDLRLIMYESCRALYYILAFIKNHSFET
jgi:hypothetical protein